jgi:hypothetical protein
MGVDSHLIEYRFLGSLASVIAALIHLGKRSAPFSKRVDWFRRLLIARKTLGSGRGRALIVLICLNLT